MLCQVLDSYKFGFVVDCAYAGFVVWIAQSMQVFFCLQVLVHPLGPTPLSHYMLTNESQLIS